MFLKVSYAVPIKESCNMFYIDTVIFLATYTIESDISLDHSIRSGIHCDGILLHTSIAYINQLSLLLISNYRYQHCWPI